MHQRIREKSEWMGVRALSKTFHFKYTNRAHSVLVKYVNVLCIYNTADGLYQGSIFTGSCLLTTHNQSGSSEVPCASPWSASALWILMGSHHDASLVHGGPRLTCCFRVNATSQAQFLLLQWGPRLMLWFLCAGHCFLGAVSSSFSYPVRQLLILPSLYGKDTDTRKDPRSSIR